MGLVYGPLGFAKRRPTGLPLRTYVGPQTPSGPTSIGQPPYDPSGAGSAGGAVAGAAPVVPAVGNTPVTAPSTYPVAAAQAQAAPVVPNNPYWQPNNPYGLDQANLPYLGNGAYEDTDVGRLDIQDNQAAYAMRQFGQYDPYSERGRFMESQVQRILQGYEQARLTNPELMFRDYARDSGVIPALQRRYELASPEALGMNYARYAPPAQTVPRGY